MDTIPFQQPVKKGELSSASRLLILQGLIPVTAHLVSSQLEAFCDRLADALFKLSDQTLRPDEATSSFNAFQLLKRNNTNFYRLVAGRINADLTKEVSLINAKKKVKKDEKQDFSLVTFDEMESKVLIRNLSQALEINNSEPLVALNIRIGKVFNRTPIDVSQNPFRPEVFVRAVYHAWIEFDSTPESHQLVLRLLQPNLFLKLQPIFDGVNEALIARGIMPDLSDAYRSKSRPKQKRSDSMRSESISDLDPYLHDKLRSIFSGNSIATSPQRQDGGRLQWSGRGSGAEASDNGDFSQIAETILLDRQFFDYLNSIQRLVQTNEVSQALQQSALRQLSQQAAPDSLTQIDQSTIELLARVFVIMR